MTEADEHYTESTDVENVPCPYCGKMCCLIDAQIDQWLCAGQSFECEHCDGMVEIVSVDWEPTITCQKKLIEPVLVGPKQIPFTGIPEHQAEWNKAVAEGIIRSYDEPGKGKSG